MICKRILAHHRFYHGIAYLDFYEKITGESFNINNLPLLKKKHPNIDNLNHEQIRNTIQILNKYDISSMEVCRKPHLLVMNQITLDNYGEILKECGFIKISPDYIIRYHTTIRSRKIEQLKNKGLISSNEIIEERLVNLFLDWPATHKIYPYFVESTSSLLDVRMKILKLYLNWKLKVSEEEFIKYCKLYMPIKHRPMADIQKAIDIALDHIKFDEAAIRRNGFIIAADPVNTKLIIENVPKLAGMDILEAFRTEPAILKTNYTSLLQIIGILKNYGISEEFQRKCLKVFCLKPDTIEARLKELAITNEFNIFASNPRVVSLVVHKKKMMDRLTKIQATSKSCYSLNNLVASTKVFNSYINNLGEKLCGRDIAILICSSLNVISTFNAEESKNMLTEVTNQLKRHKYALRVNLNVIHANMKLVKKYFEDEVILRNCQLLMYPLSEIEAYLNTFLELRNGGTDKPSQFDSNYLCIDYKKLSNDHILSLIQYELEKKYHFTDNGIWGGTEQKSAAVNR